MTIQLTEDEKIVERALKTAQSHLGVHQLFASGLITLGLKSLKNIAADRCKASTAAQSAPQPTATVDGHAPQRT